MTKICKAPQCLNTAVMDLVFGELAEQARVPWCAHCIAPHTWDNYPYHHAESYNQDWEAPAWEKDKKGISVEKCEITGCKFNAKPFDNLCEAHSEHVTKALYNRQPHYEGGIDPITFGQDNLSNLEMNGFYKMNVIKYVARCDRKNGLEDLKKAQDYLNLLIKSYEDCDPKAEIYFGKAEQTVENMQDISAYTLDLASKGDTLIPREVGESVADMVADWANDHYKDVSCYECVEGYGVVVCNKKKRTPVCFKHEFFMEKCERLSKEREEGKTAVEYFVDLFKETGRITLEPFVPIETRDKITKALRELGYNLDIGIYGDGEMDISRA